VQDTAGNTHQEQYRIELDLEPPEVDINISSPDAELDFALDYLPTRFPSTTMNINGKVNEPVNITYKVNDEEAQTISTEDVFDFSITMTERDESGDVKLNNVKIRIADRANNVIEYHEKISLDTQPPVLTVDLKNYDPSYTQTVKIRGNASKPNIQVVAFVNNNTRPSESWSTSFRDSIKQWGGLLSGEYEDDYETRSDRDGEFAVTIFLTQDLALDTTEYEISQGTNLPFDQPQPQPNVPYSTGTEQPGQTYAIPSVWENTITIIAIDEFGRTATHTGIIRFTKCGVGGDWTIDLSEVTPSVITPEHLRLGIAELSFYGELKWRGPGSDQDSTERKRPSVQNIIITRYDISNFSSSHWAIDPKDLVPQSNIAAPLDTISSRTFYVVLSLNRINYTQKDWEDLAEKGVDKKDVGIRIPLQIEIPYTYEDDHGKTITRTQKQCTDIVTTLDIEIPPEVIPKWLLEDAVELLSTTLKNIDAILEPLKQITIATLVTCLLSWVVYFIMIVYKNYQCAIDEDFCEDAELKLEQTKIGMRWICDRVFCPKVPMINKYIKDTGSPGGQGEDREVVCDSNKANDLRYIERLTGQTASPSMAAEVFDCNSQEGCCGQRYMNEWDSACIGITNELEESKCLLALESGDAGLSATCGNDIRSMMQQFSISEICEKGSQEGNEIDYVESDLPSGKAYCKADVPGGAAGEEYWQYCDSYNEGEMGKTGRDEFKVKGEPSSDCPGILGTYKGENVYIVPKNEWSRYNKKVDVTLPDGEPVTLYTGGPCKSGGISIGNCAIDTFSGTLYSLGEIKVGGGDRTHASPAKADCKEQGKNTPAPMQSDYHNLQREYVVSPTKGLIISTTCVCLPAIIGHLVQWRNILTAVKQCFETILYTGDGSPGVCRDVLSSYVCDMIFNAIRCFTDYFGGGMETEGYADVSNVDTFLESVGKAGGDIQSEITGRYGDTGLYNTMFNQRKLMTAACLYAFTGDFDFDLEGLLSGGGAVPLESKASILLPTRRYMGSNPLKKGYASWIYHVSVMMSAGSDVNYHVTLVCSNTNECRPEEGFVGGRCDCAELGERTFDVTYALGGGYLRAGEMIGPNDGAVHVPIKEHAYRYNKVRLIWEPANAIDDVEGGVIEADILQEGDNPPVECQIEPLAGEFRCHFAVGDAGFATFVKPPTIAKTEPYLVGEVIDVSASIEKRSPGFNIGDPLHNSPADQIPFYLVWRIKDLDQGSTILKEGVINLIQDGTKTYTVPPEGYPITEDAILGFTSGGTYSVSQDYKEITPKELEKGQIPAIITVATSSTFPFDFFVLFGKDAIDRKVEKEDGKDKKVYKADKSKINICRGQITTSDKGKGFKGGEDCERPALEPTFTSDFKKLKVEYKGMTLEVPEEHIKENTGFIVDYEAPKRTDQKPCKDTWTTDVPKQWQLELELRRCKRNDESLPYSSTNCGLIPSTEIVEYYQTLQKYDLPFQVACSEKASSLSCPYDTLLSNDCMCGDEKAKSGEWCHINRDEGTYKKYKYISCTANVIIPNQGKENQDFIYVETKGGKEAWCGCRSNGLVESCHNMACQPSAGIFTCKP